MKDIMFPGFADESDQNNFDFGVLSGLLGGVSQGAGQIIDGVAALKYGPDAMYEAQAAQAQAEIEAQRVRSYVWIGVAAVMAVVLILILKK